MSNDVTTRRAGRRDRAGALPALMAFGAAAACAALAVGETAAALLRPQAAPVIAIGSAAIDLAPTAVKEWAVRSFGTSDKTVLLTGTYTVMALLAVALGPWRPAAAPRPSSCRPPSARSASGRHWHSTVVTVL